MLEGRQFVGIEREGRLRGYCLRPAHPLGAQGRNGAHVRAGWPHGGRKDLRLSARRHGHPTIRRNVSWPPRPRRSIDAHPSADGRRSRAAPTRSSSSPRRTGRPIRLDPGLLLLPQEKARGRRDANHGPVAGRPRQRTRWLTPGPRWNARSKHRPGGRGRRRARRGERGRGQERSRRAPPTEEGHHRAPGGAEVRQCGPVWVHTVWTGPHLLINQVA